MRLQPTIVLLAMMLLLQVAQAMAVTVTAPTVIKSGQPFTTTINTGFIGTVSNGACTVAINFGDNLPSSAVLTGCVTTGATVALTTCTNTANHTYSAPGIYPVTATVTCPINAPQPDLPNPGATQITVASDSAALDLKRQELSFPANGRGEITVKRNQPGLKARAALQYTGTGILRGYWEVDGRLLQRIDQMVMPGGQLTLETMTLPPIPTFDDGVHTIRLIIEAPSMTSEPPVLVYYVTTEESTEQLAPLRQLTPQDEAIAPYAPLHLEWEPIANATVYHLTFIGPDGLAPLYSAYLKEPRYTLPQSVLENYFAPGYRYPWRVIAYQHDQKALATSPIWHVTFGRK